MDATKYLVGTTKLHNQTYLVGFTKSIWLILPNIFGWFYRIYLVDFTKHVWLVLLNLFGWVYQIYLVALTKH